MVYAPVNNRGLLELTEVGSKVSEQPEGAPSPLPADGSPMPPPSPQPAGKQKNTLGLIALIVGIVGFVFACIPGALIIGWVLLPIAFILGIVGLFAAGKAKGTSIAAVIVSIVGAIVGVTVFVTVVADAVDDALKDSGLAPSAPTAVNPPAADGDSATGTRDKPLPIGQTVSTPEWQVTLGAPREAWAEIAAENSFNDPPKDGMEYWIVPVTATYTGENTGTPWLDITVKFVGSDNRTYDERCGVIPNPLDEVGELYKDGVAEGNTCVAVPAGADGLWTVSTGFAGKPVFFTAN